MSWLEIALGIIAGGVGLFVLYNAAIFLIEWDIVFHLKWRIRECIALIKGEQK